MPSLDVGQPDQKTTTVASPAVARPNSSEPADQPLRRERAARARVLARGFCGSEAESIWDSSIDSVIDSGDSGDSCIDETRPLDTRHELPGSADRGVRCARCVDSRVESGGAARRENGVRRGVYGRANDERAANGCRDRPDTNPGIDRIRFAALQRPRSRPTQILNMSSHRFAARTTRARSEPGSELIRWISRSAEARRAERRPPYPSAPRRAPTARTRQRATQSAIIGPPSTPTRGETQ